MKSLKEQIMGRCRHFNGISNETCDAGVAYADVRGNQRERGGYSLPCLFECNTCDKVSKVSEAEANAEIAEWNKRIEGTVTARNAIVAHAGPWKKGEQANGATRCPVCDSGTLSYSRASSNGHIMAKCSTDGCVSWME